MQESGPSFVAFYQRQIDRTRSLDTLRLLLTVGVGIILLALLVYLQSPWQVWVYVALLFMVTYFGAYRQGVALGVTRAAVSHLLEFAKLLRLSPSRDEFLQLVASKISPDDDSNVPEAVWTYCSGSRQGESARVVAHSAFVRATADLNLAHFLRAALVLGGLFGTVFFFAIELGGHALLGGDLSVMLPGLRGALVSTLTGILGSVALGILGSSIDRVIDEAVWETESFIGGPVTRALTDANAASPITDETELWAALRHEVALLRKDSVEAYQKLADDAHAYAKTLEAVSQQLAGLPAVQVPPALAGLSDVVARFGSSTESLERTVRVLVEAVATVGLIVPERVLNGLASLHESAAGHHAATLEVIGGVRQAVQSLDSHVQRVGASVETTSATASQIAETVGGLGARIDDAAHDIGGSVGALADRLETVTAGAHAARSSVISAPPAEYTPSLQSAGNGSRRAGNGVEESPPGDTDSVEQRLALLSSTMAERIDRVSAGVADAQQKLEAVDRGLASLDKVYRWHERAARAPLMRLMLLPFWSSKQAASGDAT